MMYANRTSPVGMHSFSLKIRWAFWGTWSVVVCCTVLFFLAVVGIHLAVAGPVPDPDTIDQVTTTGQDPSVTLMFGGDVMLGRLVDEVIRERGPRYIWGNTLPLLLAADITMVNLECVIAKKGTPFFPPRVFYFRASPRSAETLSIAGVDYVSLANNHAMDFTAAALLETIQHLDRLGIAHAGAGRNLEVASRPARLEAAGVTIGVVAFADHFREYAAGKDSAGINFIQVSLMERHFARVRSAIQMARADGADLVIFSIHWGPNMRQVPTPEFVQFAHAVIDAGADIFYGHSAHIFQGIELYKGKLILYDTGDLIDDYYVDPLLRNDQQLLFIVKTSRAALQRVELVPVLIDNMQVNLARSENFADIRKRIARLSRRYGTEIHQEKDRLVVRIEK